jgi:para-aminobenzoate synthetase component I
VWLTQLDPATSPLDVALRLARRPGLAWLDGGLEHGREGRFSFVSTVPSEVVEQPLGSPAPLSVLDRLTLPDEVTTAHALAAEDVPLWVGHVAYDAVSARGVSGDAAAAKVRTERALHTPASRFARYAAWYAFDHLEGRAYLVGDDRAACERLQQHALASPLDTTELRFSARALQATKVERHRAAIEAALTLIREGELYEINLARRFVAEFEGSALGLFLRLRRASPVPLGIFIDGGTHAIAGRSMERFLRFRVSDRSLSTSPIKGTLAREGNDAGEAAQLVSDPKERAEHAMVVDLMRNDLSRVCRVGSVQVSELMAVLPFAGLSHLVSTVVGTVQPETTLRGLLEHTFPPGSVTGTPKQRVMRAIAELEDSSRGLYTGCTGFVDRAGGCSFAVAIRTAVVSEGQVEYFAGGGIVADSDPQREADETDLKARMFLRALEDTVEGSAPT